MSSNSDVICPYCRKAAELVDSSTIYARSYGMIFICIPCDAYVGVHKAGHLTGRPLGTLANAECRKWRQKAHSAFDRLWNRKEMGNEMTRWEAYRWMASKMHLPEWAAHIAMFDIEQCRELIQHVEDRNVVRTYPTKINFHR